MRRSLTSPLARTSPDRSSAAWPSSCRCYWDSSICCWWRCCFTSYRSGRRGLGSPRPDRLALAAPAGEAVEQSRGDPWADEMRDVAAQFADLLDETRGDELVAVGGHQEHGLDVRVEAGVYAGHLELVFEIGDRAQAAQDDAGTDRLGEMHQQGVERLDLDPLGVTVFEVAHLVAYDLDPLVGREQRALRVIAGNPDDQMIHHIQGAPDDVAMAVGDRIEGAGIDPDAPFHLSSPSPLLISGSPSSGLSGSSAGSSPPFSSATSGSRATETTRSPSPSLK